MNFNVVENHTEEILSDEDYAKIKHEYVNTKIPVTKLQKKYNLNVRRWCIIRDRIVEEIGYYPRQYGRIQYGRTRPREKKEHKNYHFDNLVSEKYIVRKTINGKYRYFGAFTSEKEAQKCVEVLKICDWDINLLKNILRGLKKDEC